MRPIIDEINKIILNIFGRKNRVLAEIIINWGKIVGMEYSSKASPFKITPVKEHGYKINILHIIVENSSVQTLMSYQQGVIIERIAVYLGYKAIHKLRFITGG